MSCFSFSFLYVLLQNQRTGGQNRSCPGRGGRAGTSERGEVAGKGGRRVNMAQKCVHMYVNAKMIPVETIPGIEEGWDKGEQWRK
jgi:hypothetical protein